jgi:thioredoxin-related protein
MLAALPLLSTGCKPKTTGRRQTAISEDTPAARFLRGHELEGRVVLIQFGLFDCEVSKEGLDQMMRLHRENIIPHLVFVRVEAGKDQKAADRYYAAKSPAFAVYRDPDASVSRVFGATVYPTFVLVDKFARVRYRGGFPDEDKLSDWVEALLEQQEDAGPDVTPFGVEKADVPGLLAATRLPRLDGAVKPLREYMGQHGLLVVFVDTSCPFSGTAIGDMPNVAATLANHGVPSVLVNLGDSKDEVLDFYAKRNTGTPVLYDVTTATLENWKVDSVPTVCFLDTEGKVSYRGKAVWSDLAAAVEKVLELPAGSVKFGREGTEFG